jgi:hypothetical protein
MDQMRGDNKQKINIRGYSNQLLGLLGDIIFGLVIGMLCLFVVGGIVGAIWNLVA